MSVLLLVPQPKFPLSFWLLLPKLSAGALAPYWAIMGVAGAVIGWIYQALWAIPNFEGELVSGANHNMCGSHYQIVDARVLKFLRNN